MDELRPFLIGTAGHVDHGKTTLVQAITGTNTDRLAEEQKRGMSIDLGFAEFRLPSGRMAGIVDVPGHERFLKNMLAGAAGVDFGLLVVAADEGVMPQTVEHLAIMQALRIPKGLTVLTKADTVEAEWLQMVEKDVRLALGGTFLADAPVLPVDSVSGTGLGELVRILDETAAALPAPELQQPVFLPVDRVFHRPGFGLVVTGSLRAGVLREGDTVTIYPAGRQARVRGLQTFGHKEPSAEAGMRTAVNLAGVNVEDIERGDVLAAPGSLTPSTRMNVLLEADELIRPLKHRARVRVHIGTAEVLGRILLWESAELKAGIASMAQLHLEQPTVARRGDRFVVRWYSPQDFLGGGEVLEPDAAPFRARDEAVVRRLRALLKGEPGEIVAEALADAGDTPLTVSGISRSTGLSEDEVEATLRDSDAVRTQAGLFSSRNYAAVRKRILDRLTTFHRKVPLRPGMPKEELRAQACPGMPPTAFDAVLTALEGQNWLALERETVRKAEHSVTLRPEQQTTVEEILAFYREAGWRPPYETEVTRALGPHRATRELWQYLATGPHLVALAEGLFLDRRTADAGVESVRSLLREHGRLTVGEFRDAVGASRRAVIPFLEWCDTQRITRRNGDHRIAGPALKESENRLPPADV